MCCFRKEKNMEERKMEMKEVVSEDILSKAENYEPPEFGSFNWLYIQAGYQKLEKVMQEDTDIKDALKDLLYNSILQVKTKLLSGK